jgi:hypothetical protein
MLIQSHVAVSLSHQASVKLNSVHLIRYTSLIITHVLSCYAHEVPMLSEHLLFEETLK